MQSSESELSRTKRHFLGAVKWLSVLSEDPNMYRGGNFDAINSTAGEIYYYTQEMMKHRHEKKGFALCERGDVKE